MLSALSLPPFPSLGSPPPLSLSLSLSLKSIKRLAEEESDHFKSTPLVMIAKRVSLLATVVGLGFHKGGFVVNFEATPTFLNLIVAAGKFMCVQSDLGQPLLM